MGILPILYENRFGNEIDFRNKIIITTTIIYKLRS